MPIAAPAFAVLAVFTFIAYWNSFFWPLIIISDTNRMTVPLGLQLFLGQQGQRWELLMAAASISMVPTVMLVIALQKYWSEASRCRGWRSMRMLAEPARLGPPGIGRRGRKSVTDDAITKIRHMILSGQLAPGDRLPPEADLAAELGLSRTSPCGSRLRAGSPCSA